MRKLFILALCSFITFYSRAQVQLGVFGGVANYQGDLTDRLYQSSRYALGFTATFPLSTHVSLRSGLTFAKVAGADSLNKKTDLRLRNLSFQSAITELSLVGEFYTFDMEEKNWSPYIFAGLAVYHFNPYTYDRNGNQVFLRPLSTEGEGLPGYPTKPYALTQLAIPFGGGIKYRVTDNIMIGLELGMRKLFTDHLDDVSGTYADPNDLLTSRGQQAVDLAYRGDEVPGGDPAYPSKGDTRGSPKYKDYYYFTGLNVNFVLPEGKGRHSLGGRTARKKGYGCPANMF